MKTTDNKDAIFGKYFDIAAIILTVVAVLYFGGHLLWHFLTK